MADPVSGPAEIKPVLLRDALQISVVIHVLEIGLERVVVNVRNRKFRADARNPDCLELQIGHRSSRVLRERLVDFYRDVRPALDRLVFREFGLGASIAYDVRLNIPEGQCAAVLN